MTTLDELFAASLARQSDAVAEPDFAALESAVLGGARRRRRIRVAVNASLTIAASVLLASAAWATVYTSAPPAEATPTPESTLTGALPEPSLNPVWDGTLYPLEQAVPSAFADGFNALSLPMAENQGRNYPDARQMEDWVWDEVGAGWSLQTWAGPADDDPAMLYLASPGGTFFLVRELDEFEGAEEWSVQGWSAHPAQAVLAGMRSNSFEVTRRLVDLRTGKDLRVHGYKNGDTAANDTVLLGGFADGRSLELDFSRSNGYNIEDDRYEIDGDVHVRIVAADGTSQDAGTLRGLGGVPVISAGAGDGHTAFVNGMFSEAVTMVDLDTGTLHPLRLDASGFQGCSNFARTDQRTVSALCSNGDETVAVAFDLSTGVVKGELGRDFYTPELQGIRSDGTVVDTVGGKEIDIARAPDLAYDPAVIPVGPHSFALTNAKQLILYDRDTGQAYTVLGSTVPGARAASGVQSLAVLPDLTSGAPASLALGYYTWF